MTAPGQLSLQAAQQAARAALNAMQAAESPPGSSAVSAYAPGASAPLSSGVRNAAERAARSWSAAEQLLRVLTAREDLGGAGLIAEARRQQRLTLSDANALAALQGWASRTSSATDASFDASGEMERAVAREALLAVDHAVQSGGGLGTPPVEAAADGAAAYMANVSALGGVGAGGGASSFAPPGATSNASRPTVDGGSAPRDATWVDTDPVTTTVSTGRRGVPSGIIMATVAVLLVALIGGGIWYALNGRGDESMYRDAVAAYQRGARETARVAFARLATTHPDDPRPLVFLGRMAREENDMPRAKRFLESAVRADPNSALAQRELGSVLLLDGQPELARKFYVRALQIDPTDRVAQGFLGCALLRLNRFDEAKRWFDRAGPGDWTSCISAAPSPYPTLPPPQPLPPPAR